MPDMGLIRRIRNVCDDALNEGETSDEANEALYVIRELVLDAIGVPSSRCPAQRATMGQDIVTVVALAVDSEPLTISGLNAATMLLMDARELLRATGEWSPKAENRIQRLEDYIKYHGLMFKGVGMLCPYCGLEHPPCSTEECYCGDKEPTKDGSGYNDRCYAFFQEVE